MYASRQDLIDRYGDAEIAQRESALPPGATDRALADADAEIDSYLAGRYETPLAVVPSNILRVAAAIARARLLGDAVSEQARTDYEDARAWLRDVQAGKALVAGATVQTAAATPAGTVSLTNGRDKAFAGGVQ